MLFKNFKYFLKKKKHFMIYEKKFKKEEICFNYLYLPSQKSNQLLVVFPAFGDKKDEVSYYPSYNYVYKLKDVNCHKLFILDVYQGLPSYCLGNYRNGNYEKAIVSIIQNICDKYAIGKDNIITFGSSKGGFCALYYAIKYNFGLCFAAACQTKVGSYLYSSSSPYVHKVLKNITGEDTLEQAELLDKWIYDMFKNANFNTQVFIHISENDHHFYDHIIPYWDFMRMKRNQIYLDIHTYVGHNNVINYMDDFINKFLLPRINN